MQTSELESFLISKNVDFKRFNHAAVFTCAEASKIDINIPGVDNKNLFLSDQKRTRYFLVTVEASKRVDLKHLAQLVQVKSLRFGSPQELMEILQIEPGSVSLLALVNDTSNRVEIVVDESVWNGGLVQCHPLINTATFVITCESLSRFFEATRHGSALVMMIPERKDSK